MARSGRIQEAKKRFAIADDLERRIRANEYGVGDRIPSQRAIAAEYGVAVLTARAALEVLANSGLVEPVRGSGYYVTVRSAQRAVGRAVIDDEEVRPSEVRAREASPMGDPAWELLGRVVHAIGDELHLASAREEWRTNSTQVTVEWRDGAFIDEVVARLLPAENEAGVLVSGIYNLRLVRSNSGLATLEWREVEDLTLRLIRHSTPPA